jgi:hypothetical protein
MFHAYLEETSMAPNAHIAAVTPVMRWTGRAMSALPALFLFVDGAMKLAKPEPVVKATVELGYPESVIVGLGIVLLACVVLYVIPPTAVLGAILLTGYLGGAVATHVRVGAGLFPITFPIVLGVLLWAGLVLRDNRVRDVIPLVRPGTDHGAHSLGGVIS